MRKLIVIIFFVLTHSVHGQKSNIGKSRPGDYTKKEFDQDKKNHNCNKNNNYSFAARLKNYPFNISTSVQIVSFLGSSRIINGEIGYLNDSLPRLNDTVCYSKLREIKTLTFLQIDKLTDILYNYGYRGHTFTIIEAMCYNPRNAILFLDRNGKAFEFIEICFECQKTTQSSPKISLGGLCDQKLDMLKQFFKMNGIKYGVENRF